VDLRLISILPPTSTQGVQQTNNTQGNASNGLTNLSGIPSGTLLSGFIVNRDSSGNPVLRTDSGDITFASNFFLKIGSEVQIRVEQSVGNTLARILTVNGQSPEVAETQSSYSSTPDVILSQALSSRGPISQLLQTDARAGATLSNLNAGSASSIATGPTQNQASITVAGTVISPPQQQTSGSSPLPIGTQLTLKLLTLNTSSANAQAALPADILPTANPASYAAYARATGATAPTALAATQSQQGVIDAGSAIIPTLIPAEGNDIAAVQSPVIASNALAAELTDIPQTASAATPAQAPSSTVQNVQVQLQPGQAEDGSQPLTVVANQVASAAPQAPGGTTIGYTPSPVTTLTNAQPGQTVTGIVIGNEPTGEALVQTGFGIIRLQPGTQLPTGSSISFELVKTTLPQTQLNAQATQDLPASLTELAHQWGSLVQIFGLLSGRDSAGGMDFIQPNMPWLTSNPNPQSLISPQNVPTGLMFFMSALKGEDFKSWIGRHNIQWLEDNGHEGLVRKASGEFSAMAKQFNESSASQQWQTLLFPIAVDGEVQQARLFVKRDKKQGGNRQENEGDDTRFVVEIELSQLGEVQMDGFVRKAPGQQADQPVHFDLLIRTKAALPADVQRDIMSIYTSTGELTGYQGSLQFQSVKEFPVNPLAEINQIKHNIMTV